MTALIKGRDTTADAITWTLYLILRYPSTHQRVLAEIDSIPSGTSNIDLPSHLPFLEAVTFESLRLYPPAPIEVVQSNATEDIALPDGSIVTPAQTILWSPWTSARLPTTFGEDAEIYRPERWLEMSHKPTAYELPIFHAGPRGCLGQQMAKLELLVVMKELLQRYTFEMGWDGVERFMRRGMSAPMLGGLPVKVKMR